MLPKRTGLFLLLLLSIALLSLAGPAFAGEETESTVTFKLKARGGTVSRKKVTLEEDEVFGKLPRPVREGYKFRGWFTKKTSGTKIRKTTKVASVEKRILYAHWKLITYKIEADRNGGSVPEGKTLPEEYTVESGTIRLPSLQKEGYTFKGWYVRGEDGTEKIIKKIKKGSTGNISLVAKYEPLTLTIRFRKNGVLKTAVKKIKVRYGKWVTLPKPEENAFASWNTSPDGSGTSYAGGERILIKTVVDGGVLTLYANPFIPGNNIRRLYDYFQRIGFTKEASAAIVANLMYESGGGYADIKLNAVEWSTGRGIGMCQWTNTADMARRTNFENYCASCGKPWPNQDLKVQVDFLMAELEGVKYGKVWYFLPAQGYPASYQMTLEQFKKLKNAATATAVFCANFERPRPEHANLTQRANYAAYVMQNY